MNVAMLVATVDGTGHLRPGPGTWGSLVALPLTALLHLLSGPWLLVIAIVALWFAALGGALAWTLHFLAMYALAPLACDLGSAAPLHSATAVMAGVACGIAAPV